MESFVTLRGSGIPGTVSTTVVFTGPSGTHQLEPSTASSGIIEVWIPVPVAITVGDYSVSVVCVDATGQHTVGPVAFHVVERPDENPPQLSLPEVVVGEATNSEGGIVEFDVGDASCDRASGSFFPFGQTTVHCTATNQFGTSSGSFLVVMTDSTSPVINVPDDIVTDNAVVTYTVTATDNIDGQITRLTPPAPFVSCSPASGATFPAGETEVQCVSYDAHLNATTASFKVTVSTGQPPTLFLPGNITAEADSASGAVVEYVATAVGGPISCSPASGSLFALGTTTVNCSATNVDGTSSGSFSVSVVDTTSPDLVAPEEVVAEATGPTGAAVTFSVTATDLVDSNVTVNCTPASGSTFALGTTPVNCTATDDFNNSVTGTFDVIVRDTTPPAINTPASPYHVEATSAAGAVVNYTVTATDLVDGSRPVTCTPASGFSLALNASQVVTCTSSDTRNNSATATFTVEVSDRTAPTILSIDGSPREIIWPPNHKMIPIQVIVVASDAVDPNPFAHIVSVSSSQPDNCNCGDGDVAPDWNITGDLTVEVRAERTSGQDRTYTITVEVTDSSGNTSQGTLTILVHP